MTDKVTDKTVMTKSTCLADSLAAFLLLLPRYWEQRIAPPAASAESAWITKTLMESTRDTAEIAADPTLLTIIVSAVPIREESSCSTMIGTKSFRRSWLLYK